MQRGLVGEIIGRFERKGFVLKGLKLFQTPKELAQEHYKARARLARPTRPTRPTRTDIYFGGVPLPPLRLPAAATAAHAPCATGWRRHEDRTRAARPRGARGRGRPQDLSSKPFYGDLVNYIISGPVVAMARHYRRHCDPR